MKQTLTLLAVLLLVPLAPLHVSGENPPTAWPSRPKYPIKMEAMSDAEFGRMFFAEIDLTRADMAAVESLVARQDYPGALAAWGDLFVKRCRSLPLEPWPYVNHFPVDPLMAPDRVIMQHGMVKDFGPVGQMDWYGLTNWCLHVNMMWHPSAILRAVEQNTAAAQGRGKPSKYSTDELLVRWRDIWRDYVNNNWRIGMPLAYDTHVRQAALAKAGLKTPPNEWGSAIAFRQQLVLQWPLENWIISLEHASRAAPDDFDRLVPPRVLAEMAYFTVVWPLNNLLDGGKFTADQLSAGVPNQTAGKITEFLRLALLVPEFHRTSHLQRLTDEAVKIIIGAPGFQRPTTDHHPDGSGSELSYNYMKALVLDGENWLTIAGAGANPPDWVPLVREAVDQRKKFLANLETPTGLQVLCKGVHPRKSPAPVPHDGYTSIAFPYHGLYLMRSDWTPEALFLSLQNPRRGQGHEANDGNKLMLEAFGRYLLVASGGEHGWAGSSWAQCTVNVDGLGQARTAAPRHGAYPVPLNGRWHTSAAFDFAESTYAYGYGALARPQALGSWARVNDVQHLRQVAFVKDAGLWLVVDTLLAPNRATHRYEQVWNFPKDFPNETVTADAAQHTISTHDVGKPNLFIYQSSPATLSYRKFYGEGNETGQAKPSLDRLTETARGWHNIGSGYDDGDVYPAPVVHTLWQGGGRQTVVTALVPTPNEQSPVASFQRIAGPDRTGLELKLKDGRVVHCLVSLTDHPCVLNGTNCHAAIWTEKSGTPTRGLLLDAPDTTGIEFIQRETHRETVATIRPPDGFRWTKVNGSEVPSYLTQ